MVTFDIFFHLCYKQYPVFSDWTFMKKKKKKIMFTKELLTSRYQNVLVLHSLEFLISKGGLRMYHSKINVQPRCAAYSFKQTVRTIASDTRYGSQLEAGRRSSRYPFFSSATDRGIRILAPRLATPEKWNKSTSRTITLDFYDVAFPAVLSSSVS